jgi:hypothetical protein
MKIEGILVGGILRYPRSYRIEVRLPYPEKVVKVGKHRRKILTA